MVETGFHSAKYCRIFGIPVVGAKAFDRNVSGNTAINTTELATRASRTESPIKIPIQAIANPKSNRNRKPKKIFRTPEVGRQPTIKPVIPITVSTTTFSNPSPSARPKTTALREIGSDLKRSIRPFCISSAKPTAVPASVKATVWTKIPGINNWT